MHGYYINLDRSVKRREDFEREILKIESYLSVQRFSAIDGKLNQNHNTRLSAAEFGCYLSHLNVIKNAKSNENILIIEDDEIIHDSLKFAKEDITNIDSDSWDIVYLDMTVVEVEDFLFLSRNFKNIISGQTNVNLIKFTNSMTVYGTHAYVVNFKSLPKIIHLLETSLNLGLPIDNVYCAAIQQNLLNALVYLPLPMAPSEETFSSSIATSEHPLMRDWTLFRKTLSAYYPRDPVFINNDLKHTIEEICINRLKFACLETFNPLNRINN